MADILPAISKIQGAYADAVLARDVSAFMRLYDPKVRVFDTWGVWQYEGASAWEGAVDGWFKSLGAERVRVTFEETQAFGTTDGACMTTIATYTAESAQGETLRAMQNRMTWGLRLSGHVLRIVHEHTSVPIGFEDLKALTQRAPGR